MKTDPKKRIKEILKNLNELRQEDFSFYAYQLILASIEECKKLNDDVEILSRQKPGSKSNPTLAEGLQLKLVENQVKKTSTSSHDFHVLVIDDDEHFLNFMQMTGQNHGIEFSVADNLEQASSKIYSRIPDAIVIDIMMPVSGFDVLKKLKENSHLSSVPLFLGSSRSYERDQVQAYRDGADALLTKPYDIEDLKRRITNHNTKLKVGGNG